VLGFPTLLHSPDEFDPARTLEAKRETERKERRERRGRRGTGREGRDWKEGFPLYSFLTPFFSLFSLPSVKAKRVWTYGDPAIRLVLNLGICVWELVKRFR
jgi:hypothetical protein